MTSSSSTCSCNSSSSVVVVVVGVVVVVLVVVVLVVVIVVVIVVFPSLHTICSPTICFPIFRGYIPKTNQEDTLKWVGLGKERGPPSSFNTSSSQKMDPYGGMAISMDLRFFVFFFGGRGGNDGVLF